MVNHVPQRPFIIRDQEVAERLTPEQFEEKKVKEDLVICHKFLFNELQDFSVRYAWWGLRTVRVGEVNLSCAVYILYWKFEDKIIGYTKFVTKKKKL